VWSGGARLDVDSFTALSLVRRHSDAALHCAFTAAVSTDWHFQRRRIVVANTDTASRKSVCQRKQEALLPHRATRCVSQIRANCCTTAVGTTCTTCIVFQI